MPIYEYRCEACQNAFEAFLATSSEKAVCPACQGTDLSRLMSTFASSVAGGKNAPGAAPSAPRTGGCGGGCACH